MADPKSVLAYDIGAEEYDAHVSDPNDSIYHSYYEKPAIRKLFGDLTDKKVLNIGCGSGVDTHWIVENGAKSVVGIDLSKGLIDVGKKKYPDLDLRVMDMEKLEFDDESFDLLVSSLAIHYLPDRTDALKEAFRVLAPGGRYVLSSNHPLDGALEYFSNGDIQSALVGRNKNTMTGKNEYIGDYLKTSKSGVSEFVMPIGDLKVTTYTQTFANMVRYIREAGFTVESVAEPIPSEQMKTIDLHAYNKLSRLPFFIIWELRK
jgi:ubiquinone/menaquinone biosynthesis C-methylase UbiE